VRHWVDFTDVLQYLLKNGANIGCRSLEAASKLGNPECVRLLLEHGAKSGSALLECLKRENETVIRQLMTSGMGVNDYVKQQILDAIEKDGLASMSKIFENYN
jgi:ankyrin repeat protein